MHPVVIEVIEVINCIFDFTVPPQQITRLWRLLAEPRFTGPREDLESPGACMSHCQQITREERAMHGGGNM